MIIHIVHVPFHGKDKVYRYYWSDICQQWLDVDGVFAHSDEWVKRLESVAPRMGGYIVLKNAEEDYC